ncbi:MAG: DsbA family protein [Patescibacteria group bacterium]
MISRGSLLEKFVPILLVISVALAFLVGVLWQKVSFLEGGKGAKNTQAPSDLAPGGVNGKLSEDQAKKVEKPNDKDRIRGSLDAEVYLIEYSDLECPFCKQFHATAQQAVEEYKDKVTWVYRHFPLDTLHPKADKEAEAAECAFELGGQDGFWKYVDKIFEVTPSNNGLDLAKLPTYAGQVGLNQTSFKSCLDGGRYADLVEEQYQGGITAGVTGTPGNFIMNKKGEVWVIPGAVPFDTLKLTIDEALKS